LFNSDVGTDLTGVVLQAKELGVRSVIIDGPDSWCQTLQDEKMIEQFIGIDFADADSVFDKCLAACKKVKKVGLQALDTLPQTNTQYFTRSMAP